LTDAHGLHMFIPVIAKLALRARSSVGRAPDF
jgi:hypothetical protein